MLSYKILYTNIRRKSTIIYYVRGSYFLFNNDIREELKRARIYGYELAAALGIAETSLSRKLARRELTSDEKAEIFAALAQMQAMRKDGENI